MNGIFQLVDSGLKFYRDKHKIALEMGFNYVSECWYYLYWEDDLPLSKIAGIFELSNTGIRHNLHKIKSPLRSKGGKNFYKITKEQATVIKSSSKMGVVLAKEFNCSSTTISKIRKHRNWNEK